MDFDQLGVVTPKTFQRFRSIGFQFRFSRGILDYPE